MNTKALLLLALIAFAHAAERRLQDEEDSDPGLDLRPGPRLLHGDGRGAGRSGHVELYSQLLRLAPL